MMNLAGYAVAVTVLSLMLSPVFFQGGKALAEVSLGRPLNRPLEWFANRAGGAGFHEFFVVTYLGFALLLLPPLADRLRADVLPQRTLLFGGRQWRAARTGALGFLIVLAVGVLLLAMPWTSWGYAWSIPVFVAAFALAFVFEWVFRGVLFGVMERLCRPVAVVVVTAVAFVLVRLLLSPPEFAHQDQESWSLGWQMIGKLLMGMVDGGFWVAVLLPWIGWGVLLGLARLRFESLWPPVFLHAGWLVVSGVCDPAAPGWISWGALCAGSGWAWFVRESRDAANEEN